MAKIPGPKSDLRKNLERLAETKATKEETLRIFAEKILPEVAELELAVSKAKAETQETYDGMKKKLSDLYVDLEQVKQGQATLQEQYEKVEISLSSTSRRTIKEIHEHRQQVILDFKNGLDAAQAAFSEQQAIRQPVDLWKEKQLEHVASKRLSFFFFATGLLIAFGFVSALIYFLAYEEKLVSMLLAPAGCDPTAPSSNCSGFSLKGTLLAAGVLTLFTLLLWFIRLQMKLYLAERHLALDARERLAFAQSYLGLVREGDTSEEAREQRALVYAALFRPASDGTVREEGGLDPSVAAALSKFLLKS